MPGLCRYPNNSFEFVDHIIIIISIQYESLLAAPLSLNPFNYGTTWPYNNNDDEIHYGLDNQTCEKINKKFSEKYPEIYHGLVNISTGAPAPGSKNNYAIDIHEKLKKN